MRTWFRRSVVIAAAVCVSVSPVFLRGQAQAPEPVASMSELMVDLVYPTSDPIFYVSRKEPENEVEWNRLQLNALTLAEAANLLMSPERALDEGQWMADARLLLDVGRSAYRAAKARDFETLVGLNDQLYESCQSCHEHYRPGYRRRP